MPTEIEDFLQSVGKDHRLTQAMQSSFPDYARLYGADDPENAATALKNLRTVHCMFVAAVTERRFFHCTDRANLASILRYGLLPYNPTGQWRRGGNGVCLSVDSDHLYPGNIRIEVRFSKDQMAAVRVSNDALGRWFDHAGSISPDCIVEVLDLEAGDRVLFSRSQMQVKEPQVSPGL